MCHLRLGLEDRAHELGQVAVDVHDLLELVQHQRDLAPALGGQPARQLEQPLQRGVQVLGRARAEKENDIVPSSGSTVTVGRTRRPWKTCMRSLALNSTDASSS